MRGTRSSGLRSWGWASARWRLRLPGPDRDLPRHRRPELLLGATAIAGVFMQWELQEHGWPFLASAVAGVAWSAFLGGLTHWVIMRPRRASSLVRVIATLGVLITIQAAVVIRYGSNAGRSRAGCRPTADAVGRRRDHGRSPHPARHRDPVGAAPAVALPNEPVRPGHRGGVGERTLRSRRRAVPQPDR